VKRHGVRLPDVIWDVVVRVRSAISYIFMFS